MVGGLVSKLRAFYSLHNVKIAVAFVALGFFFCGDTIYRQAVALKAARMLFLATDAANEARETEVAHVIVVRGPNGPVMYFFISATGKVQSATPRECAASKSCLDVLAGATEAEIVDTLTITAAV